MLKIRCLLSLVLYFSLFFLLSFDALQIARSLDIAKLASFLSLGIRCFLCYHVNKLHIKNQYIKGQNDFICTGALLYFRPRSTNAFKMAVFQRVILRACFALVHALACF